MKPGDLIACQLWGRAIGNNRSPLLYREYTAIYLDENMSGSACRVLVSGRIQYIPAREVKVINETR